MQMRIERRGGEDQTARRGHPPRVIDPARKPILPTGASQRSLPVLQIERHQRTPGRGIAG